MYLLVDHGCQNSAQAQAQCDCATGGRGNIALHAALCSLRECRDLVSSTKDIVSVGQTQTNQRGAFGLGDMLTNRMLWSLFLALSNFTLQNC